jgi:predicted NBD/HSP70 family sugar kinase
VISLGLDIGGSSIKCAVLDGGAPLWTGRSQRYQRPSAEQLRGALAELLTAGEVWRARLGAVGLCVPGVLDERRRSVALSANVPGLVGVDLKALVREAVGRDVGEPVIATDARAGAHDIWITHRFGGRLLAVSLGTGVGGCVLDDGVPVRLTGESSGHIGQIDVSLGDAAPVGPDGGRGSLEAYIGLPALVRSYGPDLDDALGSLTAVDEPLRALARALRIVHAVYRPDHIVLLGGVGVRLAPVIPLLRTVVENGLTSLARPGWTLRAGSSEFHAALGAARLAADG